MLFVKHAEIPHAPEMNIPLWGSEYSAVQSYHSLPVRAAAKFLCCLPCFQGLWGPVLGSGSAKEIKSLLLSKMVRYAVVLSLVAVLVYSVLKKYIYLLISVSIYSTSEKSAAENWFWLFSVHILPCKPVLTLVKGEFYQAETGGETVQWI